MCCVYGGVPVAHLFRNINATGTDHKHNTEN
jgi:hypothetical protein